MKHPFTLVLTHSLLLATVLVARAQGTTAFVFQGQLENGGTNASGVCIMVSSLYDAPMGGKQLGGSLTNRLIVVDGFYSVTLDFGVDAFPGPARWLDISAFIGGTLNGPFPRVPVTPIPYAMYATGAGAVTNRAIASAQLAAGAVANINLASSAVMGNNIAGGQVVRSLNGLADVVNLSTDTGLGLTTSGNTLQLSDVSVAGTNANLTVFTSVGKDVGALLHNNDGAREYIVLNQPGAGCLTHMFFSGIDLSPMRIRVYVDGETNASIDMANDLGTGFANNQFNPSTVTNVFATSQMGACGRVSIYNNYHIPFGNGVRVTVYPMWTPSETNISWTIRGTQNLPLMVGGQILPPNARLKLYRNEWYAAQPLEEFNLCAVQSGPGQVYEIFVANSGSANLNFLEGQVRGYFNGSTTATLLSSGTEDFFLGAGYFWQNKLYYSEPAGLTSLNQSANYFSAYRLYTQDPVCFQDGLRLTLRCGEQVDGVTIGNPETTAYATYTWVYQW